jgi:hypothetical protein
MFTESAPQRNQDLILPWPIWAYVWIIAGAICLSGVLLQKDMLQYMVAAMIKTAWAMLYFQIWIVQHDRHAWVFAIIWFSFAATVILISRWPEPVVA